MEPEKSQDKHLSEGLSPTGPSGVVMFYSTKDEYGPLTNFSKHPVIVEGVKWETSEHLYQAMKFAPHAVDVMDEIRYAREPGDAARIGRDPSNSCRSDWDEVKDDVMRVTVALKVMQNSEVRALLESTGSKLLVENSPKDSYWGCGADGKGKNMLGQVLMEIREQLPDDEKLRKYVDSSSAKVPFVFESCRALSAE